MFSSIFRGMGRSARPVTKAPIITKKLDKDEDTEDIDRLIEGTGVEKLIDEKVLKQEPQSRLLAMLERVDDKQCRGCGAKFQFDNEGKEGYISVTRVKQEEKEKDLHEILEKLLVDSKKNPEDMASLIEEEVDPEEAPSDKMYDVDGYESDRINIENIEELESIFEKKVMKREICDRCVMINNGEYGKMKDIGVNIESM